MLHYSVIYKTSSQFLYIEIHVYIVEKWCNVLIEIYSFIKNMNNHTVCTFIRNNKKNIIYTYNIQIKLKLFYSNIFL